MSIFSDNLTKIRKASKKPRAEIAEALNVSLSAYGMWEQGRNQPDLDKLRQLAKIFACSVDSLLGTETTPLEEYQARLAEIGLEIVYTAGHATIRRAGETVAILGKIKADTLAEQIKKAMADYDRETADSKSEYILQRLEQYRAEQRAKLTLADIRKRYKRAEAPPGITEQDRERIIAEAIQKSMTEILTGALGVHEQQGRSDADQGSGRK